MTVSARPAERPDLVHLIEMYTGLADEQRAIREIWPYTDGLGEPVGGVVFGFGMLLAGGLGDTMRVSLTRDPVEEVRTAYEILRALGIRNRGPELISCPTCGRCRINLFEIAEQVEKALLDSSFEIKVAIMGCVVNGPGEAREADIGIAGGDGKGILFKRGKVIRKIDQDQLVDQLLQEIDKMTKTLEEN